MRQNPEVSPPLNDRLGSLPQCVVNGLGLRQEVSQTSLMLILSARWYP